MREREVFSCAICGQEDFINEAPQGDSRTICLVCAVDLSMSRIKAHPAEPLDVPPWAWSTPKPLLRMPVFQREYLLARPTMAARKSGATNSSLRQLAQ